MDEVIISILVPMYNASTTILRCLEVLAAQCGNIAEVVVLDDGSTDDCLMKAKEIEEKNPRIRVYSQENQGVACTRQHLLDFAHGKYIMFCDADDYFQEDAVSIVYKDIMDMDGRNISPDVFVYGYNLIRTFGNKTIKNRKLNIGIHSKKEFAKNHATALGDLYWSALWNKCYKKEICLNFKIKFETLMEDVLFNLDYFSKCEYIYISPHVLYNYVQIGESLTRTKKADDKDSITEADEVYKTLYKKALVTYPTEKNASMEHMYLLYSSLLDRAKKIDDLDIYNTVKEHRAEFSMSLKWRVLIPKIKRILIQIKLIIKSSIGR